MNAKNMSLALIAVLVYEVLLKLTHILTPSLHEISFVTDIIPILRIVTGIILVTFVYFFYREEKQSGGIGRLLKATLLCVALSVIIKLPILKGAVDVILLRVIGQYIGLIISVLLLLVIAVYKKTVPAEHNRLHQAAMFLSVTFAIAIVTSAVRCFEITRFAVSGEMTVHSPAFFFFMFILFLVTHAAAINFLCRYYQFKLGTE